MRRFSYIIITNGKQNIRQLKTRYYKWKMARLQKSIEKKEAIRRAQLIEELTKIQLDEHLCDNEVAASSSKSKEALTKLINQLKQDQEAFNICQLDGKQVKDQSKFRAFISSILEFINSSHLQEKED